MPLRWRPDGDYVRDLSRIRRIMPFIMRKRNESTVFFEQKLDATKTLFFLNDFRDHTGLRATMLHLLIYASAHMIKDRPRMNRFVAGGRIFQRRGIWISFSAKKRKTEDAPIVLVKREVDPSWSFEELVQQIEGGISEGRSDKPSTTDTELSLIFKLPNLLVRWLVWLLMKLDHWGLLPGAYIKKDPLFASIFIVNLGSIDLDAGYHHLYEYGNIPMLIMAGRSKEEVAVGPDGKPEVRSMMTLRYSFDERIEDGLYGARALEIMKKIIENPASYLLKGL
ncbi:2-oxo acid dehydrogenase subunit E2 [Candidatus Bathyarchaeota archaeon]|nr:2-oxo acid dehydrogenase subunit E2 [Candidatus Bathyarchaeota archaeon]